jgi:hypothetical protein
MKNVAGLAIVSMLMVFQIMSTPVPEAHTRRECIPIGAALEEAEAQPEYEQIGDWTIRR